MELRSPTRCVGVWLQGGAKGYLAQLTKHTPTPHVLAKCHYKQPGYPSKIAIVAWAACN